MSDTKFAPVRQRSDWGTGREQWRNIGVTGAGLASKCDA